MEVQKMVDILRRVRHDFGNHLQVINGYTELGRSQEVKDYIVTIVEEMTAERIIFELASVETALYFYEQLLLARDLGIILRYEDLQINSPVILQARNEPYRTLEFLSGKIDNKEEEAVVYLSLYEKDGEIDVFVSCEQLAENSVTFSIRE